MSKEEYQRTFARGKTSSSLNGLRVLLWMYRIGSIPVIGFGGFELYERASTCAYRHVDDPLVDRYSGLTGCEILARNDILYRAAIPIAAQSVLVAGHLAAIVISVLILRWRQQWVNTLTSSQAPIPPSPHRGFTVFSGIAFFNTIILCAYSLFPFFMAFPMLGYIYAVYAVVGAAFVGFLHVRMQAIDTKQPVVRAK
ncbi:hypothetical protein BJ742DRAFT_829374 [Cladochytrium replicatum]|nr:hypothetical protein BJ742DRAFT_829374 [Cladochytrium replicatum]